MESFVDGKRIKSAEGSDLINTCLRTAENARQKWRSLSVDNRRHIFYEIIFRLDKSSLSDAVLLKQYVLHWAQYIGESQCVKTANVVVIEDNMSHLPLVMLSRFGETVALDSSDLTLIVKADDVCREWCASIVLLATIAHESGLPSGLFNVLCCDFDVQVPTGAHRLSFKTKMSSGDMQLALPTIIVMECSDIASVAAYICQLKTSGLKNCRVFVQESVESRFDTIMKQAFSGQETENFVELVVFRTAKECVTLVNSSPEQLVAVSIWCDREPVMGDMVKRLKASVISTNGSLYHSDPCVQWWPATDDTHHFAVSSTDKIDESCVERTQAASAAFKKLNSSDIEREMALLRIARSLRMSDASYKVSGVDQIAARVEDVARLQFPAIRSVQGDVVNSRWERVRSPRGIIALLPSPLSPPSLASMMTATAVAFACGNAVLVKMPPEVAPDAVSLFKQAFTDKCSTISPLPSTAELGNIPREVTCIVVSEKDSINRWCIASSLLKKSVWTRRQDIFAN